MQLLDTALNRFSQALAAAGALTSAASKASFTNLANVGLARTNLDLGNLATAATAAATVPDGYVYQTQFDKNTTRENNGVFAGLRLYKRYGVADVEGGVGIPWRTTPDPRTPFFQSPAGNKGLDGLTPQFDELRYPERDAQVPLATAVEMRMIQAENALITSADTVGFMAFLNGPRAAMPPYIQAGTLSLPTVAQPIANMTALTTPASPAASITLLFNERAHWLWLTGHRLNDLRRLVRAVGTRGGLRPGPEYGLAERSLFQERAGVWWGLQLPRASDGSEQPELHPVPRSAALTD